jgi:hypothetical protein
MEQEERRLPVGIQSFEKIRKEGFLYVDKTDIVWQLVNKNMRCNYLSRPRRFGKSVLIDTLQSYFEGRKELFEGLKIMELEKEWVARPVIRLDMSRGGANAKTIRSYLDNVFDQYERKYGVVPRPTAQLADRFDAIIRQAYESTRQQVAILIDEYDSPLQHSWMTPDHDECTAAYREVFAILKADDAYEKFVFITGITKFTQISLFSVLNNLTNISFMPQFAPLCGITDTEIAENFQPELEMMAQRNGWTLQETHNRLKDYYDGYHFSRRNMVDVYNPFSLINALAEGELCNYWASSGATSMLPKFVDDMEMHLEYFDHCYIEGDTLESSDVTGGGAELFLYQSGYLTIKGYEDSTYLLGFPNQEVRHALYKVVLPSLTMRSQSEVVSAQSQLRAYMNRGDVPEFMRYLKALIADVPYSNKKMASMDMEERYRFIASTIFNAIGFRVQVERMVAKGRIDMVVWTVRTVYVIELKLKNNGGLHAAAKQIKETGYMEPFKTGPHKVIGLAIELDDTGKGVLDWKVVDDTGH